ncbi:MAG: DEAD/DEAH box helicase family protein [Nitrospira sp.]|nr:DEAD/DEAH box helicase family protein [Nitrospira sp.]
MTEGVAQAKQYAEKLSVRFTYATNGQGLYGIDRETGKEGEWPNYPSPDELWTLTFAKRDTWRDRFAAVPFEDKGGSHPGRYYQDIAVERVLEAIAAGKPRILLTLATGTGKTFIAFQIAWKLFHSRWNLSREPSRQPRTLFLADRNILANQAYNAFSAFPEDALVRIAPDDIRKKGKVPKNGSLFFTIFQTFMVSTGSATELREGSATEATSGSPIGGEPAVVDGSTCSFVEVTDIQDAYGYMYILECADGSFYVGSTKDLRSRIEQHHHGKGSRHTAARGEAKLVYYEPFDRIDEAFAREKQIQGWSRAKKIALITENHHLLPPLSQNRSGCASRGAEPVEAFGEYPPNFFDFIVIDECHRGGANDESNWRDILEYFSPAVQLGLTATPKRKDNVDTYAYFGEPVYIYSLKDGINDGFLTPFKVKQISTTLDEYVYTPDDRVMEGAVEYGKRYSEADFNRIIEIKDREKKRVEIFMQAID